MFYLPILYYPTKEEDRATGFLIPTYGVVDAARPVDSQRVLLGDQSQPGRDVLPRLVLEDRPGRRRRVPLQLRRRVDGNITAYLLDQHEATVVRPDGADGTLGRSRSFELRGGANQLLPGNLRARAQRRLFSSIATIQTFNTNIYDISRNQRELRRQRRRRLGQATR